MELEAQVDISLMRQSDLEEVMEIERLSFPLPWARSMFENELKRPQFCCYLVARLRQDAHRVEKLIGYVGLFHIFKEGHITNLAVHPDYRRQGIGQRLLFEVIEKARLREIEYLTLEMRESNIPARKLYKKFGFFQAGRRYSYYTDTGEDALILWTGNITSSKYQNRLKVVAAKLGLREDGE